MWQEAGSVPSVSEAGGGKFYAFLSYFSLCLALGVLAFMAMLYSLNATNSLPAPPLTGTYCIDEKFQYLAEQDLEAVDLLAVGSSVTWRNLDLTPFVADGLSEHPVNAAPCYLRLHQTAYLAGFLLDHMPRVGTVIIVIAPRDFDECPEADRAFFSPDQTAPYLFRNLSPLWIYFANFRPVQLFRDAGHVAERRSDPLSLGPLIMGPYGAGPIKGSAPQNPAPKFDVRCFEALSEFEDMLTARGMRLIVVSFPTSPTWQAKYDPQGKVGRRFETRIQASLKQEDTAFIPSRSFSYNQSLYFDAVHLKWGAARTFSAVLAERLKSALSSDQG